MMTKLEAANFLQDELDALKKSAVLDDLTWQIRRNSLINSYQVAIDCLREQIHMAPRWKTIKSNKEFWNMVQNWVDYHQGQSLDDLKNYFLEEIEVDE